MKNVSPLVDDGAGSGVGAAGNVSSGLNGSQTCIVEMLNVAAGIFPPAVVGDYCHKVSAFLSNVVSEEIREYRFIADGASDFLAVWSNEKPPVTLGSKVSDSSSHIKAQESQNTGFSYVRNRFSKYYQL